MVAGNIIHDPRFPRVLPGLTTLGMIPHGSSLYRERDVQAQEERPCYLRGCWGSTHPIYTERGSSTSPRKNNAKSRGQSRLVVSGYDKPPLRPSKVVNIKACGLSSISDVLCFMSSGNNHLHNWTTTQTVAYLNIHGCYPWSLPCFLSLLNAEGPFPRETSFHTYSSRLHIMRGFTY